MTDSGDFRPSDPFIARYPGSCAAAVCIEPSGRLIPAGADIQLVKNRPWHPGCIENHRRSLSRETPLTPPRPYAAPTAPAERTERWVKVERKLEFDSIIPESADPVRHAVTISISERRDGNSEGTDMERVRSLGELVTNRLELEVRRPVNPSRE